MYLPMYTYIYNILIPYYTMRILYYYTTAESDLNRDGVNYLGKVRSNFVGTEVSRVYRECIEVENMLYMCV